MSIHKIGPQGQILNEFGLDTGRRVDGHGNILDRHGLLTGRSFNQFGDIVDGRNGLGFLTGLRRDPLGLITDGRHYTSVDGLGPLTGTGIGPSRLWDRPLNLNGGTDGDGGLE